MLKSKFLNSSIPQFLGGMLLFVAFVFPVSPVFATTANDFFRLEQWYLDKIHINEAWDNTVGSREIIVAVLDGGIDINHEDLAANIYTNAYENTGRAGVDDDGNGFVDDIHGWDFYDGDAFVSPAATNGIGAQHGTLVAGLIGAVGNNGLGISGVNWKVSILPVRVLNSDGDGSVISVVNGINYARKIGASVINLSFIGDQTSEMLNNAIRDAYANGVVVVAALGNTPGGKDLDVTPAYPACAQGSNGENVVIGVASLDSNDERATQSNYGKTCADIAAPGVGIFSTQVAGVASLYGGGWSGTSLAAPLVSGTAALIRSVFPRATPSEVLLSMQFGADPIVGLNPKGQSGTLGSGRLNVKKSLTMAETLVKDKTALPNTTSSVLSNRPNTKPMVMSAKFGEAPRVWTIKPDSLEEKSWLAYSEKFKGGVNTAVGQFDSDPEWEIVTGPGEGGGPHVRIFSMNGELEGEFYAFETSDRGGVSVAAADTDSDGIDEIIAVSGKTRAASVRIIGTDGTVRTEFAPERDTLGAFAVASGDVFGDSKDEIILAGPGDNTRVFVYNWEGRPRASFESFPGLKGRVSIAVIDEDGMRWIAARGPNGSVRLFTLTGVYIGEWEMRGQDSIQVFDHNKDGKPSVAARLGNAITIMSTRHGVLEAYHELIN